MVSVGGMADSRNVFGFITFTPSHGFTLMIAFFCAARALSHNPNDLPVAGDLSVKAGRGGGEACRSLQHPFTSGSMAGCFDRTGFCGYGDANGAGRADRAGHVSLDCESSAARRGLGPRIVVRQPFDVKQ
jgi:hypothetical protein